MKPTCLLTACLMAMVVAPALARADEVDDLVAKLKAPPRFQGYQPQWHIEERDVTFEEVDGPVTVHGYVIMDGDRCVGFMLTDLFQSGCIYILDFRPGQAPKEIPFPTERWHIETTIGAELRTDAFIPIPAGKTRDTYDWKVEGPRVVLTRRFKGRTAYDKWTHRTRGKEYMVDTTNRMVLSVDPILGFVVDMTYDTWTEEEMSRFEYASAAMSGRHTSWPQDVTCYRIAISTFGKDGWHGYATNMGCTHQHGGDGVCRDGGFVAFLNDLTGWSTTYTNQTGAESRLVVCPPHTDHDFTLPMARILKETKDGMHHYQVRHRMLAMPPELTKYVWDTMTLLHKDEHQVLLRLVRVEDFEDQPLSLAGRDRGHTIGGQIATDVARSGRQSLRWTGTISPGNPTLCVRPNRKYRLEAWFKVVDWSKEERQAAEEQMKAAADKARKAAEEAVKRGKTPPQVPEATVPGPARAYITLGYRLYDMDKPRETVTSDVVGPGDQWQHVAIDFVSPKWGPSLAIGLHAENCTVSMDDFRLAEVE